MDDTTADERNPNVGSERMRRLREAVRELAATDDPIVWVGEVGMTPEQALLQKIQAEQEKREDYEAMSRDEREDLWLEMPHEVRAEVGDKLPAEPPERWEDVPVPVREALRGGLELEPGEVVEVEGAEGVSIKVPGISYSWLDGAWVLENAPYELSERDNIDLEREILYIHAAREGKVPIIHDSWVRVAAGLGLDICLVPVDDLTPEQADDELLDMLEFYTYEGMGPYVIPDSEWARRAIEERLGSS